MSVHDTPDNDDHDDNPVPQAEPESPAEPTGSDPAPTLAERLSRIGHRVVHMIYTGADVIVIHVIALTVIDQTPHLLQLAIR